MKEIRIQGARTHNLKNIDVVLPRDQLVVITGLSGSGKSSLAFDTLYAEGQRRYVESLSTYARQFLSMMEKPDMDHIEGLSPAIAIEQKTTTHNPRSTVGTTTEISDYLRLLYARVGQPRCPTHDLPLQAQTIDQMVDQIMGLPEGSRIMLLAPVIQDRKGEHLAVLNQLRSQGFVRVRVDGEVLSIDDVPPLAKQLKHRIEVVVDRFKVRPDVQLRLSESLQTCLKLGEDVVLVEPMDEQGPAARTFSARYACSACGHSVGKLEPKHFSFNNPAGACTTCDGLGLQQFFDIQKVLRDDRLTLGEGALPGWDRRSIYYFSLLEALAAADQVNLDQPWCDLPEAFQQRVLQGTGEEEIRVQYINSRGDRTVRHQSFEGVMPNLARRYRETESASVREELARYLTAQACADCGGSRLNETAQHVWVGQKTLPEVTQMPITEALAYFQNLILPGAQGVIAERIQQEIVQRLSFLQEVGLGYLSLARAANTLSGGETQRIRLASQIGAGLVGVMYILDEPSIGLHQRDNARLLQALRRLCDLGNTVLVVEHDEEAILNADFVLDMGPGAGIEGGEVVAAGTPEEIKNNPASLTGQYLSGVQSIAVPQQRHEPTGWLQLYGAYGNNLRNVDLAIPCGVMSCITGVSGSGKSTLINGTLYPLAATRLNQATTLHAAPHDRIEGLGQFDKVIDIDQSPIGRTPRSNPATYTGIFTAVRELFAGTQEARSRGYTPGRFSFNVKGGRCEACQGDGVIRVEMHFLADVYVPCDVCKGERYNRDTLEIRYKGLTISEVLAMSVSEAHDFFAAIPALQRKLETLMDVGLSYIKLGQSATTLSGGEAQRIKLARELSRRDTGQTLYILDEPTTGLHFHDIRKLLEVLRALRDRGNTLVVIEHNLDVIKTADWVVDLGPEGGAGGGTIVATGTPEQLTQNPNSITGQFLAPLLGVATTERVPSAV